MLRFLFLNRLDILIKLLKTEEHADIAGTLNNMALIYSDLGQLQTALQINERVLSRERGPFLFLHILILFPNFQKST